MSAAPYRAPRWLPGGNLQTIYAAFIARGGPVPRCRRVRWDTPDGDFVDVDVLPGSEDAPLVALFHGLEGGARSHYARVLLHELSVRGWRGALPHFRGCSGEPNRLPRAYHSGDSDEVGWMLERLRGESPGAPLAAVGVSLGGNALLKWLGEAGAGALRTLRCAVAVSAPVDLPVAGERLGRGFNRVYSRMFLSTLIPKAREKAQRFPGLLDAVAVARARSLREFDDLVTAPLHGFRDTDDYWRRSSAKPWLQSIGIPTLLLNARNDPFLPGESLPAPWEVSPCVECDFPRTGGHAGFVDGGFPERFRWFRTRIMSFIDANLDEPGLRRSRPSRS
ncbi:MAG: alpha/beta fold hydrolase [Burkholderiales bacterium]|nr:alpha/beta fold hydrolase [Burkholderiales bacterium]